MRGSRSWREGTRAGMAETESRSDEDASKAQEVQERYERGQEKMKELEENPPENLEDWPTDEAKYTTFGGGEGDHGYEEGPEAQLGPSGLRHHEDGSVSIDGEKVDNPEEYKGDPIPGGPTDPNATGPDVDDKSDEGDEPEAKSDSDDEGDEPEAKSDSDDEDDDE